MQGLIQRISEQSPLLQVKKQTWIEFTVGPQIRDYSVKYLQT